MSTRRLKGIAQELFGQEVRATTVSKTAAYLDEELKHYQTMSLIQLSSLLLHRWLLLSGGCGRFGRCATN